MFRYCNRLSLVLMLLCLSAFAPRAFAEVIQFNTQFKGGVVSDDNGSPVSVIVVQLAGSAPTLGSFQETLTHFFNVDTLAFDGYAVFTFSAGSFTTHFSGQSYTTPYPDWLTFNVTHTIVSGTGVFQGATGSFVGVGGAFNSVTGEDVGGYKGAIHIVGNLTPFNALVQGSVAYENAAGAPVDVIVVDLEDLLPLWDPSRRFSPTISTTIPCRSTDLPCSPSPTEHSIPSSPVRPFPLRIRTGSRSSSRTQLSVEPESTREPREPSMGSAANLT